MPAPSVSVVLPCRNAAESLTESVQSIRAQTWPDWELILFDDGSTDGSLAVARTLAAADTRIRITESPPVGIVRALQEGCRQARGACIARMDADDIAHPDRLARQMALMTRHADLALCGTGVRLFGDAVGQGLRRYERWINRLVTHEDIVRELFVECPIAHPTFLLRRSAFDQVGGYQDHGWPEDYDLCMRLFLAGKRFAKVPEPLLSWRNTPGRLSMHDPRYHPERFQALKRHYLSMTYLSGRHRFHQWGAGEVGKRWLRAWGDPKPAAVVDINPRKIGRTIHQIAVIAPDDLPGPGETFIVVAVGAPGARAEIRAWLAPRGYVEQEDYAFVA
ncbi:MAG: glycosyltransferase [Candidatus Hydrogenedentes bacterium]|nr:glycosyltransferase [Candidatus Hydrogenedentota bacterium]